MLKCFYFICVISTLIKRPNAQRISSTSNIFLKSWKCEWLFFLFPSHTSCSYSVNEGMNTPVLVSKTTYPNNWNIYLFIFGVFIPVCASISVSCWPQEPSGSCLTQCLPVPMSHSQHFPHTYLDVLHHMANLSELTNQGWDVLQESERLLTSSPGIFMVARLGLQIRKWKLSCDSKMHECVECAVTPASHKSTCIAYISILFVLHRVVVVRCQ